MYAFWRWVGEYEPTKVLRLKRRSLFLPGLQAALVYLLEPLTEVWERLVIVVSSLGHQPNMY